MGQQRFLWLVSVVFTAIAALHVVRLVAGWEAVIGGWAVPRWVSGVVAVFCGGLAYGAWRCRR